MLRRQGAPQLEAGRIEKTRRFGLLGAAYAVIGGATSVVGWAFDITRLKDWIGTGITIKANASICITVAGIALLLLITTPRQRTIIRVLCAVSVIISFLTLSEHLAGWNLGIDTLLFQESAGAPATSAPGRMGIPASTSLTMAGSAIFLSTFQGTARKVASLMGIITLAISSLSIIGYIFGASQLYEIPRITGIAFQTATMIAALGCGIVAALPEFGLAAALSRNDTGGLAYRRVFFPIIVLSLGLG